MQTVIRVFALAVTSLALSGCGGAIYKEFTVDGTPATSVAVDARQRMILVTDKGAKDGKHRVICAEPSPDVFAALAAAASADVGIGEKKLGVAGSLAEAVKAVGPRTQTIQLLRDGLYRACEAYLNGIIDFREYKQIIARYDETMITMLAIDGLTSQYLVTEALTPGTKASAGGGVVSSESGGAPQTTGAGGAATPVVGIGTDPAKLAQAIKEILVEYYQLQRDFMAHDKAEAAAAVPRR